MIVWGHMASAEREPIRAPPAGSRGRCPPEDERFLGIIYVERTGNICPFTQLLKVLKYLPNIA